MILFENLATGIPKYDEVIACDAVTAKDEVPDNEPVIEPVIKLAVTYVNEAVAIEIKLPDIEFKLAKLLVIVENCANDPEMLPVMP